MERGSTVCVPPLRFAFSDIGFFAFGRQSGGLKFLRKTDWPWMRRNEGVWLAVKRKAARCSFEAALLSAGIHLLLVFLAGSTVLLNVITKRDVVFQGREFDRSELPQRLNLPVKVQRMQRAVPRPMMVRQVMRPAANRVALPVPPPLMPDFERTSEVQRQSLTKRSLPGRLDMGVSSVDFFGTKSKGEKIIFILDASRQMMEDAKGGYTTYRFAKDEIGSMVDGMPSATLFNIYVYSGRNIDFFRPTLVPATPENRAAIREWLAPINSDPYRVGQVAREYRPGIDYSSWLGSGVQHWLQAVQAAMEQTADTIFVLCGAVGEYYPPYDPGEVIEEADPEEMAEYREKYAEVQQEARRIFEKENEARAQKGLPPKIVYNWTRYMIDELRLTLPDRPPVRRSGGSGPVRQTQLDLVLDHMEAVCSFHYPPRKLKEPSVNFVYLIARDAGRFQEYDDIMPLRRVASRYDGDLETLRGSKTMHNLTY